MITASEARAIVARLHNALLPVYDRIAEAALGGSLHIVLEVDMLDQDLMDALDKGLVCHGYKVCSVEIPDQLMKVYTISW